MFTGDGGLSVVQDEGRLVADTSAGTLDLSSVVVVADTEYQLDLGTDSFVYTAQSGDDASTLAAELAALVGADADYSAEAVGAEITVKTVVSEEVVTDEGTPEEQTTTVVTKTPFGGESTLSPLGSQVISIQLNQSDANPAGVYQIALGDTILATVDGDPWALLLGELSGQVNASSAVAVSATIDTAGQGLVLVLTGNSNNQSFDVSDVSPQVVSIQFGDPTVMPSGLFSLVLAGEQIQAPLVDDLIVESPWALVMDSFESQAAAAQLEESGIFLRARYFETDSGFESALQIVSDSASTITFNGVVVANTQEA